MKDTLFTLAPGFEDNGRREYCPECSEVSGLLASFPFIKDAISVVHVTIQHPRTAITDVLGDGNFNAPTLILAGDTELPDGLEAKRANGRLYLDSAALIAQLWHARYGTPLRRGS